MQAQVCLLSNPRILTTASPKYPRNHPTGGVALMQQEIDYRITKI